MKTTNVRSEQKAGINFFFFLILGDQEIAQLQSTTQAPQAASDVPGESRVIVLLAS